jgi:dihydroorotase
MDSVNSLILRKPDDMHIHLRQGEMLEPILEQTIKQIARAVVMPNTDPAIESVEDLTKYQENIENSLVQINKRLQTNYAFQPLMTFKIMPRMATASIAGFKKAGAIAGKLYPQGVTTNSEQGITDITMLYPIFEEMAKVGLVLCIHGEEPEAFCLDREKAFLPAIKQIAMDFPALKIVLEHLSTVEAISLVENLPGNVAATITIHHLLTNLNDIIGGHLKPHLFCKPLPKRPLDQQKLSEAVVSGNPKFFLGSDSAPHKKSAKENDCGAAGVYTAPVLMPLLAQVFEEKDKLDKLESFVSRYGAEFYNLPLNNEKIKLARTPWVVPEILHDIVPFMAGETLNWQVVA